MAGNGDTSSLASYDGHSWTEAPANPSDNAASFAAACAPSFCMITDMAGFYNTWNGTSWSHGTIPGNAANDDGVGTLSCASSTFCIGVDPDNQYYVWNGQSWSARGSMPDTDIISELSCASSRFCVEADRGQLVTWNGESWTDGPSESDTQDPYSVSCPSNELLCGNYRLDLRACHVLEGGVMVKSHASSYRRGVGWQCLRGVASSATGLYGRRRRHADLHLQRRSLVTGTVRA